MENKYKALKIKGKRIDEHRYLMETKLGRKLNFNEVVHHKDEIKDNNDLENLEIISRSEHSYNHRLGNTNSEECINLIKKKAITRYTNKLGHSKLGIKEVLEIKELLKTTKQKDIALLYNVSKYAIYRISKDKSFKYIAGMLSNSGSLISSPK